jgi:hypothetical protein
MLQSLGDLQPLQALADTFAGHQSVDSVEMKRRQRRCVSQLVHGRRPAVVERLGFDEAVARATSRNPTVAQAAQAILRADALLAQARSAFYPFASGNIATTVLDAARGFNGSVVQPKVQTAFTATASYQVLAAAGWAAKNQAADQAAISRVSAEETRRNVAISAGQAGGTDVVVDAREGVFGHRVSMLDFSAEDLAHFRRIGRIAELPDREDVETALAISGSSAQSKVQRYPGDCDYFERVNIKAPTREAACHRLGEIMREKILSTFKGPDYQFIACRWGTVQEEFIKGGKLHYVHNYVGADEFHVESRDRLPEGPVELRYEFEPTGQPDLARGRVPSPSEPHRTA